MVVESQENTLRFSNLRNQIYAAVIGNLSQNRPFIPNLNENNY